MANQHYDINSKSKIIFTLPSQNSKYNRTDLSESDIKLKDDLMSLIIDTKDEAIELKITGDQYRKIGIHDEWRQVDFDSKKAAYFSYQEKAAKDFIFRFNKCGILSDQVGMGKTIEAGMIISELAYKKELGSLLILVPNENMAEKWENELAKKFGFRNYYKDLTFINGKEEKVVSFDELPKVYSVKSMADLYTLIYNAHDSLNPENVSTFDSKIVKSAAKLFNKICTKKRIDSIRLQIVELLNKTTQIDHKEFKIDILKNIYAPLINDFIHAVSLDLGFEKEFKNSDYKFNYEGQYYHIVDMYLDTPISTGIIANGIIERLIDKELISNSLINEFDFIKSLRGKGIIDEINSLSRDASTNEQRLEYIDKFRSLSHEIRKKYSILIFSKIITFEESGERNAHFNLLDFTLNKDYESESIRYCSISLIATKGYRVIDMLIDMSYKTLIVDEAHDFIKVSHKIKMSPEITRTKDYELRQKEGFEFSDIDLSSNNKNALNYFVFPLYNDYYFVDKSCLFVEVKALADRSYRKIFMTATPIKSDMVDFYLLYLLADDRVDIAAIRNRKLISEDTITKISGILLNHLSNNHKKALNYQTHEDIVHKYIYQLYLAKQNDLKGQFDEKISTIINEIIDSESVNIEILQSICVNKVRLQFQKTFTIKNEFDEDVEIHTISELVSSEEGIEQWQNMYSQIGIRATRHQTFQLDSERLEMIKPIYREKYRNLPIWSRRNSTIIYIHKKDNYFDHIVKERLENKKVERNLVVNNDEEELKKVIIDNPKLKEISVLKENLDADIEKINEDDFTEKLKENKIKEATKKFDLSVDKIERKYAPKERALEIFKYINNQLTGSLSVFDYYSTDVNYDEFKLHMVAKLMTDGLEIQGSSETKKINGKVLLFTDSSTQSKVLNWLKNEVDPNNSSISKDDLDSYISRYKHQPLWYYNLNRENPDDRWVVTTDIKALNDKTGNYLIVIEPDKYEEGVDLQSSNILINFDIKFDPLKMEQRIGRIDRVKLGSQQSQIDIISFTPLNDMSGYMVDFLANELKMFSCWKGDTTGIVTLPLGERPNSATFEQAILALNEAYKALYNYEPSKFINHCNKIEYLYKAIFKEKTSLISKIYQNELQLFADFEYLKNSSTNVNEIVFNTDSSNNENGDEGKIIFGELCVLTKKKALQNEEISHESINNHRNNLKSLKDAINNYYQQNIDYINDKISEMKRIDTLTEGRQQSIENTFNSIEKETFKMLDNRVKGFNKEYEEYKSSQLFKLPLGSMGIDKEHCDIVLKPILNRFKLTINNYLDSLTDIFDQFAAQVTDKSLKMSRFISYLTIEEFRVMADNYE